MDSYLLLVDQLRVIGKNWFRLKSMSVNCGGQPWPLFAAPPSTPYPIIRFPMTKYEPWSLPL